MVKTDKSHETGLRILEIFKILLNQDVSTQTINNKLKRTLETENVYTDEAYIKYFNTFSALGFDIEKKNGNYHLKNALVKLDFSAEETRILLKLLQSVKKLNNKNQEEIIKNFIFKLDKYSDIDLTGELNRSYSESCSLNIVNSLKQIMENKSEVNITYKKSNGEEETLNVELRKIFEEKGHYFVLCSNPNMLRNKKICVDTITALKQSPKMAGKAEPKSTVIYELYDRLVKSYKIKQWETLEDFGNGYIRISNTKEDLDTLLNRLLKYGENCKIIHPSNVVDDFMKLTNDVLANLETGKETGKEGACQT